MKNFFFFFTPEWIQETWFPGGGDAKHLQQQTVADLRPLAALQREHVLLRSGERDICPQTHELPRSLVSPDVTRKVSVYNINSGEGNERGDVVFIIYY